MRTLLELWYILLKSHKIMLNRHCHAYQKYTRNLWNMNASDTQRSSYGVHIRGAPLYFNKKKERSPFSCNVHLHVCSGAHSGLPGPEGRPPSQRAFPTTQKDPFQLYCSSFHTQSSPGQTQWSGGQPAWISALESQLLRLTATGRTKQNFQVGPRPCRWILGTHRCSCWNTGG